MDEEVRRERREGRGKVGGCGETPAAAVLRNSMNPKSRERPSAVVMTLT